MKYTKHKIHRCRLLSGDYFEVVFQRDKLIFTNGSMVTLYNKPDYPVFIASGIGEPWLRLILNRDVFGDIIDNKDKAIRINTDVSNVLPMLMGEEQPSFIFDTETIGCFFSWASTNPSTKCDVCYLGTDKIQEDWLNTYHNVITNINKFKDGVDKLYVTGKASNLSSKVLKLANRCKGSYIIE